MSAEAVAAVAGEPPAEARVTYELSRAEYFAAHQATTQVLLSNIRSGRAAYGLAAATVICGIVIGMGYAELVNGYFGSGWRWKWYMALAVLGLCLITIWQRRLHAARVGAVIVRDDSISLGPQSLTLMPEGLSHVGRAASTQVAWAGIQTIRSDDHNLLIILNNYFFLVVPHRAFADAAQHDWWLAKLRHYAPHAWSTAQADRQSQMPLPAATAPVEPLATGVRSNLRAGSRLAFFQRVTAADFVVSAEAFIALALLDVLLQLALSMALTGFPGEFNPDDLPQALWFVPLTLLFGVVAARVTGERALLLTLPVALVAAGLVISLVSGLCALLLYRGVFASSAQYAQGLFYLQLLWWSAIIAIALRRFMPPPLPHPPPGLTLLGVALLVLPLLWLPPNELWIAAEPPELREAARRAHEQHDALASEKGYYAQQNLLARALAKLQAERPGVADVYTLTAGLYASEDVFMKEVKLIDTLLRSRFDAEGRALMLINNAKTVHDTPLASATSLAAALKHIGGLMNVEEDVLVMYLSSHGSQNHELAVDFHPLRLQAVDPPALKKALDASKIKWKVLVVSACYSGGFVEPLKDEHTLIITAASATKTSFGCGHESDATYLATALFDEALRQTHSFERAFEAARQAIRQREQASGHEPSDPQIFVGAAIREKLQQVEQRLSGLGR